MKTLAVGKIVSPWGLKGECKFHLYHSSSDIFHQTRRFYYQRILNPSEHREREGEAPTALPMEGATRAPIMEPFALESARQQGKIWILRLKGIHSPEQVAPYKGKEIFISLEDLPPPQKGEYYTFQLLGMQVLNSEGKCLGEVKEVAHYGASDILVIQNQEGQEENLIPLVEDFVKEVSKSARKIFLKQ